MSPWTKMEASGAALCSPIPLGPGDYQSIFSSLNSTVLNIFTRLESQYTCLLCLASFTLCHIPKSDSSESVPALPSESPRCSLDPFSSLLAVPGSFALLRQTVRASSHSCWFWSGEPFLVSTNLSSELFVNTVFTKPLHQFSDKTIWWSFLIWLHLPCLAYIITLFTILSSGLREGLYQIFLTSRHISKACHLHNPPHLDLVLLFLEFQFTGEAVWAWIQVKPFTVKHFDRPHVSHLVDLLCLQFGSLCVFLCFVFASKFYLLDYNP